MMKRLQVLVDDAELRAIQAAARRRRMTTAAWVRDSLRDSMRRDPGPDARAKLDAIRTAARHSFPVADIDVMLAEIARGYLSPDHDPSGG